MVRSQHKKVKPHKAHAVHHASHPSHAVHHASHASHGVHHASHASHSVHHASHASHSVHRVSKPAVHESHSQDSVLYFLEDYNKYRSSKIQLLSSKSSVLMSRERIKKLKELKEKVAEVLSYDGPVICDVMVDPEGTTAPRLASEVLPNGKIVSKPMEDLAPFLDREEFNKNMED